MVVLEGKSCRAPKTLPDTMKNNPSKCQKNTVEKGGEKR